MIGMAQGDLSWGLFRPSYWIYPSLVYWMPVGLAHIVRLLMFAVAIAGPVLALRRNGLDRFATLMAALLILSAGSLLINGLFFISLQELSGAALVGIGFLTKSRGGRALFWVLAAWFKSPFSWLLIGEAIVLWRRGHRRQAVLNLVLGLGTLVVAAAFARAGEYTDKYGLDLWRILTNASKLVEVWTTLVLVMLLWWVISTQTVLRVNEASIVLLIGFTGYTAQMLPWAVSGYYLGPIIYLMGLFLASLLTNPESLPLWRKITTFTGPLVIALYVVYQPLAQGLEMNTILSDINKCLVDAAPVEYVLEGHFDYVSTEEGVLRIQQNAQLTNRNWNGSVSLSTPNESLDSSRIVCSSGTISLYRD